MNCKMEEMEENTTVIQTKNGMGMDADTAMKVFAKILITYGLKHIKLHVVAYLAKMIKPLIMQGFLLLM